MKIVELKAEGFKRLSAVQITPEGNMITLGGKNGAGKSSVLDAIWVALAGRAKAPPKPVNKNVEKAIISLDLGDLIITRTFTDKGDGKPYTDTVKVENSEGLRYGKPQDVLNALLGEIGFDPFAFMNLKASEKAEKLLELVPLPIDLDEHAELDASDYAKRRDANRDIENLKARVAAIPREEVPENVPDREALVAKLGSASQHNLEIEREAMRRADQARQADNCRQLAANAETRTEELQAELARAVAAYEEQLSTAEQIEQGLGKLPELETPLDVAQLQEEIRLAETAAGIKARQEGRAALEKELADKTAESEGFTKAMADREKEREVALSKAKMPVDGLGFQIDEKGKPVVTYQGLPFDKDQISTAAALRVSTAIAMASNPALRVLQIRDGSLLDEEAMKILADMAEEEDFQLWIERVGTEGVGIVIEDGHVRGAESKAESQ